jgi:ATP-dependent Lon protease
MNIFTQGERRYRIVAVNTTQPYLRAEAATLEPLPAGDAAYAAMPRARQMFDDYLKTYFSIADQWVREVYLPDDPGDASDYIAARCDVAPEVKQRWLEEMDPEARLRMQLELISEALPEMHGQLVAHLRQKTTGFTVQN